MTKRDGRNEPSYEAFSVKEGAEEKSYFKRIGTAFRHKDGEGHTISLNALPVNDKIVLRTPKERLDEMRSNEPRRRRERDEHER